MVVYMDTLGIFYCVVEFLAISKSFLAILFVDEMEKEKLFFEELLYRFFNLKPSKFHNYAFYK